MNYQGLILLDSYVERLKYLTLHDNNYKSPRDISNPFYKSSAWLNFRRDIIDRDMGYDLGVEGEDISGRIIIHHINPIEEYDLLNMTDKLLDPNNAITTSIRTHNLIHYKKQETTVFERKPDDTLLWSRRD